MAEAENIRDNVGVDVSMEDSERDKMDGDGLENSSDESHMDAEEQPDVASEVIVEDVPIQYTFVEGGSIRGRTKLFDGLGYSYIFKKENKDGSVVWRCPVRTKEIPYCPATVKQVGDSFSRGPKCHLHNAVRGSDSVAKIRQDIEEQEQDQPDEVPDVEMEDDTIQYKFIEGGSIRGRTKLFDSLGYSYIFKREYKDGSVVWRCPVRTKEIPYCPATVKQVGDSFSRGPKCHLHNAVCGSDSVAKIRQEIKASALSNPREKPVHLVRQVLTDHLPEGDPRNCPSLPSMEQLLHTTRAIRRKKRPEEPTRLDFDLQMDHVPVHFFVADVVVSDSARHLVFATENQLQLLAKAKCWYADSTFKVCHPPFVQLFSLHAFIQKGESMKQVPLAFVLMSRRHRRDYRKVFRAVKDALPGVLKVKEMVMDFEAAMWRGAQKTFPEVLVRGCNFHWRQAVWRKVQNLGLRTAYIEDPGTQAFIRRLMALPMLPEGQIRPQFDVMMGEAANKRTQELCHYIRETWMSDGLWAPQAWCVFGKSIRTNNDVEGWHHKLNTEAGTKSPFYQLLSVLHGAAKFVQVQDLLVSEGKLKRTRRRCGQTLEARLFHYWGEFEDGTRSADRLLEDCSRLLGNMDASMEVSPLD